MSKTIEITPEFIQPAGVKPRFGISRSVVYELISAGLIKSRVVRRKGNIRGIRLISVESIRQYIESQPEA